MYLLRDGNTVHFFTADPANGGGGQFVGSVGISPGEKPTSAELLYRLGVRSTPWDFDFAVNGGALGTYLVSRKIPSGAYLIGGHYKVDTTFTSAADGATMSIGSEAAADLMAATAISTGTTWDAATGILLPNGTKDTVLLTADRQISIVVGTEVLTAGKMSGAVLWTFEGARAKSFTAA